MNQQNTRVQHTRVRRWVTPFLQVSTILAALFASQTASAQCCNGNAVGMAEGAFVGDVIGVSMIPGQIVEGDAIYFTVVVPEKAILQINGDPTISQGVTRYFVVRGLQPDRIYTFVIVAETANPAGVAMEETRTIKLRPGSNDIITMKPVKRKVRPIAPVPEISI